MNNEKINLCPACGFSKQDSTMKDMSDKLLCFHCWFRSNHGTTKMMLLYVLFENKENFLTINELVDKLNNHPIAGKKKWSYKRISELMQKLKRKKNRLIYEGKKVVSPLTGKKSLKTFKITTPKGIRYLNGYLMKWDEGKFVELRISKYYRKVARGENKMKKKGIKGKIKSGEYDRFKYIFVNGKD